MDLPKPKLFKKKFGGHARCQTPGSIQGKKKSGEASLLTVLVFLLTVELLCLQSVEVLLRHTFPL